MFGFPRKGKTAARNKRGLCAFNGFTCEFERSELLPLPNSHKGFVVKPETLASFGIPRYAPKLCICRKHRMQLHHEIVQKSAEAPVDITPPTKRVRRSRSGLLQGWATTELGY